jgi:hypothetical protein
VSRDGGGRTPADLAIGAIQVTIGTTAPRREPPADHEDITTAYSEVLRRLLAAGASLEPILRAGGERGNIWLLDFLTGEGIDLARHLGEHGREWLGVAVHARDEAWIDRLLAAGVDADALDRRGETLLHAFTYHGFEWQLRRALEAGVEV